LQAQRGAAKVMAMKPFRARARSACALAAAALAVVGVFVFAAGEKKEQKKAMNSIFVIVPYKYHGSWVFDDPAAGLTREPFVAGIDIMIDQLVADIPDAENGFRATFSARPFPGATTRLEWRRSESGGNWYYCEQFKMEGWLCPALFKYFPSAPKEIHVKAEPKR
jgi:hypothetical protein